MRGPKSVVPRDEILNTIKELAEKLERPPSYAELNHVKHVSGARIVKLFGRWSEAIRECGLEPLRKAGSCTPQELFEDYCRVVRKVAQTPTGADYERHGKFSAQPFRKRFGKWKHVPSAMIEHAAKRGLTAEYADVVEILREANGQETTKRTSARQGMDGLDSAKWTGHTLYGRPLMLPAMAAAPTNEDGVLFLFGVLAERLGYTILRVQSAFPDIEVLRRISKDHCQRLLAELEYESKNFVMHNHDVEGCALIICWRHNWPECPLEVLELEKIVEQMTHPAEQR